MISKEQLKQILGKDAERFYELLQHSSEEFSLILDHFETQEEKIETSMSAYDNAAWPYKQAHVNGARRVYKTLRGVLTKDSSTNG